jgi:hypothetical protein
MRFRIAPRDVPADQAAKRLGVSAAVFCEKLPNLLARGFPKPDPDTGNFDLDAIDQWCNSRNAHLFGGSEPGPRDARTVAKARIAHMRGGNG